MNTIKTSVALFFAFITTALFAQDNCIPIGWANYDGQSYVGAPTGGGNAVPVEVSTFAALKAAAESSDAKVIYVKNSVGNGYTGTSGDVLYVKSNKTIIGYPGVTIWCSWQIKSVSNIIIRNLTMSGPGNSNSNQNWDCVNIENSKRIWVDHCTIMDGEDGNFDVVKGSDNVSVTWCIFTYSADGTHNLSNLVGSSDNEPQSHGKLNITYANCWWKNVNSRTPRTRYGKIHVLNCYYSNSGGTRAGFMANQRNEACYFDGISSPIGLISPGGASGIFPINCTFVNCSGNQNAMSEGGYTVFTPPYSYNIIPAANVKASITNTSCGAGPTMDSPTSCGCGNPSEPTLELTTGSALQVIITGATINPVVYTWGGSATDANVSNIPAGLIATKNNSLKTITLSGIPLESKVYTITTQQSSGSAISLSGTINVTNAPEIHITAPDDGFSASAPASVQIEALASDTDGSVAKVDFYNGNQLLGTDANAPYSFNWTDIQSGSYYITAVATDNLGASSTSEILIIVTRNSNEPITIQAETACEVQTGDPVEDNNAGYNGNGYVNLDNAVGTYFRINVVVAEIQTVEMTVRYAASSNRNMSVNVNGAIQIPELQMPSTGSFTSWNTTTGNITLKYGINSIIFTSLVSDGGPNIDQITFSSGLVYETTNCTLMDNPEMPATLKLTSGNVFQTIEQTNSIAPIVFTWGGSATDVTVTGMPVEITVSKDASNKTVTISGSPANTFIYTITTIGGTNSESKTGTITVLPVTKINLRKGWNMIGYPFTEPSEIPVALSGILTEVEAVKNFEGFWESASNPALNLLSKFEYGQGYFIKVSADCVLEW